MCYKQESTFLCLMFQGNFAKVFGWEGNTVTTRVMEVVNTLVEPNIQGIALTEKLVTGIPVRLYTPEVDDKKELLTGVVFFHGGGWHIGSASKYILFKIQIERHFVF